MSSVNVISLSCLGFTSQAAWNRLYVHTSRRGFDWSIEALKPQSNGVSTNEKVEWDVNICGFFSDVCDRGGIGTLLLGGVDAMFRVVACSGCVVAACVVYLVAIPWLYIPSLRLAADQGGGGEGEPEGARGGAHVGADDGRGNTASIGVGGSTVEDGEVETDAGADTGVGEGRKGAIGTSEVASTHSAPSPSASAAEPSGVWSLLADPEIAAILLTAVAVGAVECLLEGVVMMHLAGVMGYSHAACAGYLALFNVKHPRI